MDANINTENDINNKNFEKNHKISEIHAKIFEATDENIKICADYLKSGGIVGMPTETVYGLAANAFDIPAVRKIFEYKGRPLSDPLIVHITTMQMAKNLIKFDPKTQFIFEKLAEKFWPGPMTIVMKADFEKISPILTANTEYIGIRFPKNDIAKKLIEFSGIPIAAPSANKFCHVSPVNPHHVFEDFKEFPVYILDGGVSNFCMESTVIKIIISEEDGENFNKIQILRMGAISKKKLDEFFEEVYKSDNFLFYDKNQEFDEDITKLRMKRFIVEFLVKEKAVPSSKEINDELKEDNFNSLNREGLEGDFKINQEAPGQFIKHYSPHVDTFIFECDVEKRDDFVYFITKSEFEKCVVLDYKKIIKNKFPNERFLRILDLSETGNHTEVMQNLYNYLRLAEKENDPKYLLICNIEKFMEDNPDKLTLVDRIFKASSNRKIIYMNN